MRLGYGLFVLLLLARAVHAQDSFPTPVLDEIRFAGNEVTRESVMRQEMVVHEGDTYTPEQVEKSRQALMNLGLFKTVRIEPVNEGGKNILLVTVDERFYILPLPLLDYRPGFLADETATNYSYGGEIRFDNLFGLNQRLKISYEEKKYVDSVEPPVKKTDISYIYPRIIGTPYHLEVDAEKKEKSINHYTGSTLLTSTAQTNRYGRIFLSRWLNAEGVSEGWRLGAGVAATETDFTDTYGVSGYQDSEVVSLLGELGYYKVNRHPYHRDGQEFSYAFELAHKALSSDAEYLRNTFTYRLYRPLHKLDANINTQLKVGLAYGDGAAYSLGSSTSLRGYGSDTVQGNFLLQGNFEYHHHLSGYRQLRGVAFVDVANVWPEVNEIDRLLLYSSVGLGARWRVQSFVDITLRLDYAYNTETGATRTYLATSGSF